jgi:hypothetical protein
MADATWKATERAIAALFGTVRIPPAVYGQRIDRGNNAPDAETPVVALQIKHGYSRPGYLADWMSGIVQMAPIGKIGAVVWHPKGAKFTDSLVLLRAADFAQLLRRIDATSSPSPGSPPGSPADTAAP